MEKSAYGVYNLGCGTGLSNKEIIDKVFKKIGTRNILESGRRLGDSDTLVADISKAKTILQWTPLHTLDDIVDSLDNWYSSSNYRKIKFY